MATVHTYTAPFYVFYGQRGGRRYTHSINQSPYNAGIRAREFAAGGFHGITDNMEAWVADAHGKRIAGPFTYTERGSR